MQINDGYIIRYIWWFVALLITVVFIPFIILALSCRWTTYDWCNENCLERVTEEDTTSNSPSPI
tara:strand:- start:440 stop:631 length:192 start_codon:yes stop_codon:yes gene_type:complete